MVTISYPKKKFLMRIIKEKVINQKSSIEQNQTNPKKLFKKIVNQKDYEWLNENEVLLKSESSIDLHTFCLESEKNGLDISYITKTIIEVGEENESEKFDIRELGSKDVVLSLLDGMINFYKLKYLSEWEKNHSVDSEPFNSKITELKNMKSELINFIGDSEVEINLTIKK